MSVEASHKREILLRELRLRELRKATAPAAPARAASIDIADRTTPLPLSWTQQRLWFIDQFDPAASAAYHMPVALRLTGPLDRRALQAALDRVVARHEVLRTRFQARDGQPTQIIAPAEQGFSLSHSDLSGLSPAQREPDVARLAREECARPFDLSAGPLIRGQLLRLGETEHVLLLTQHHIISDGWSVGVLIGEIAALYAAFSQGQPDPLPSLPIQYADYAAWQRSLAHEGAMEASRTFWKEQLRGAPALLEVPLDRPREAARSHAGGSLAVALPPALAAGLRALGQRHGATLFMTLLAGWSLLLSRLSGQDDVVIGTPIANRQRREFESMLGFFANTLALRVRPAAAATVAELLEQVKTTSLAAYAHQDLPFEEVVEAINPARSTRHSPLFQSILTLNNTPREVAQATPHLQVSVLDQLPDRTPFDLALSLTETGDRISGVLTYASALFDDATMQRWLRHFVVLLEAMVADPTQSIARLPVLDAQQRLEVLERFNATAPPRPQDQTLHAAFERAVASHPDALAVVDGTQQLSFNELNRRANRIAHRLIELGVKPDDRVVLCMERSADMLVGLLGILKSGAAYVPIDPALPTQRQAWLLQDSAPVAVVTNAALVSTLPAHDVLMLALDDDHDDLARQPQHDPVVPALTSHHLAYVIYTSGSTGQPKGVMVEHRSLLSLWNATKDAVFGELPPAARITLNASLSFDASVLSLVQWLSGHTLVVVPAQIRADAHAMAAFLREQRVDAFDCTPAQLELLLDADSDLPLQLVVVGGEAIASATWRRLAASTRTRYYNAYGPTECTVCATFARIGNDGDTAPHIGKPLANSRVYILDAQRQPVPVGVVGELYIGGFGAARGYLNRPELTIERFIDDPFSNALRARMYRTGDLGYWRADGTIAYVGRNDFQIKLRGLRIELGEIEAQLLACEGVREAAVVAREETGTSDKRLVAYLLAHAAAQPTAAVLRQQLSQVLPDYMVPSAFVLLPAWPLTSNGKLDRPALPAPGIDAAPAAPFEAPCVGIEAALAQVWCALLQIERVGRDDNFFDLGGHSLLAAQLVARIQAEFGVSVSLMQVFQAVTLAELGEAIAAAQAQGTTEHVAETKS